MLLLKIYAPTNHTTNHTTNQTMRFESGKKDSSWAELHFQLQLQRKITLNYCCWSCRLHLLQIISNEKNLEKNMVDSKVPRNLLLKVPERVSHPESRSKTSKTNDPVRALLSSYSQYEESLHTRRFSCIQQLSVFRWRWNKIIWLCGPEKFQGLQKTVPRSHPISQ